jgi:hypothetical protein
MIRPTSEPELPYRIGGNLDFAARVSASDEEHHRLRRTLAETPLRELPAEAVDAYLEYIDAAHYDGGFDADQLRYYLPRVLELLALADRPAKLPWMPEHLERILDRGSARMTWPAAEIAAIGRILVHSEI